jgi:glycosyltransferase involved in cell wall biosynthesis
LQVSVIIPIYNAAAFLEKAIQSACDQSETAEVILVDDRSTDNSLDICNKWKALDSRVSIFLNDGPKGSASARNIGLKNASCDYIAFLDADDYFLENRFKIEKKVFDLHINIDGIARCIVTDTSLDPNNSEFYNNNIIGPKPVFQRITIENYHKTSGFSTVGLTFKKSCLQKSGFYDTSLLQAYDQYFNINLIIKNQIFSIDNANPVAVYVIHPSNTIKNLIIRYDNRARCYSKLLRLAFIEKTSLNIKMHYFKCYIENEYLYMFSNILIPKMIGKLFLLPILLFKLIYRMI